MKKERRTFSEWFKDIAGIEGDLKDTLKPAVGYTSGNIMLGGAGYPISMYHQQYLTYVEGLSTKQAGFISLIGGMWDAITDPIMGIISDHTRAKSGRHRRYLLIAVIPVHDSLYHEVDLIRNIGYRQYAQYYALVHRGNVALQHCVHHSERAAYFNAADGRAELFPANAVLIY